MSLRQDRIRTELLVIEYGRGRIESMGGLVSIWQSPLYYYIRRLVKNEEEALDVLQEVWLRVIRNMRQLRDPAAFPAWLFAIARNTSYRHLAKTGDGAIPATAEEVEGIPSEEDGASLDRFSAEDVHSALAELSLAHCECLTLKFIEGFSLSEISDITGVPLGTVKSRLFHARKSLRDALIRRMGK